MANLTLNGWRTAEIHLPNWVTKSALLSDCYIFFANSWITQKFRHCLCFQSRGIHFRHFYWATMFAWSRKCKSTSGSRGTDDSVLWIFEIFTLFMFSRSGNPLLIFLQSYHVWETSKIQVDFRFKTYSEVLVNVSYSFLKFLDYSCFKNLGSMNPLLIFLQSYHVWVTSKIQVDFRFNTYSEVLVIVCCGFLKFLHYLCFWGQGILSWHSYWATMFGGPRKIRSPSGPRGFWSHPNIRFSTKML